MVHYTQSYAFGKQQEVEILPLLAEKLNRNIQAYPERYSKHDYFCDNYNYEVKSRTNRMAQYPTTMITEDKAVGDKPVVFVFNYTDKIALIDYDKEKFAKYERRDFSRANLQYDQKPHIYIPIEDLTVIHQK
jgi:hypothetical protein